MKYVVTVLSFVLGYVVARLLLGFLGMSATVQLVGGLAAGYLATRPMLRYYAKRDEKKVLTGIFGGDPGSRQTGRRPCHACNAGLDAVSEAMVAQRRQLLFCPACGGSVEAVEAASTSEVSA